MAVKTYIRYANYSDEFEVAIVNKAYNGERFCLPETKFVKLEQYEITKTFLGANGEGPPTSEILQSILDAAWEQGLRPTGFTDIKNETTAIKYHLEDMRKIAFNQLEQLKPLDILAKYALK